MKLRTTKDGMVICARHALEVGVATELAPEPDPFYNDCVMCNTRPVEGNVCAYEPCKKPLHPQWPVVYCSNECARAGRLTARVVTLPRHRSRTSPWRDADEVSTVQVPDERGSLGRW